MKRRDKKKRKFDSKKLKDRTQKSQQRARSTGKNVIDSTKNIPILGKLGEGKHYVDIIPYIAGKNDQEPGEWAYTFEYYIHRNIGPGKIHVICLQATFDKECPVCKYQQKLREKGDERYKEYWPKKRNLYNVICYDKNEKDKGIQVMDVTWHWFEKYLCKISEKLNRKSGETEIVNFSSPSKKEGRTIEWNIELAKSENDFDDWIAHSFDKRDYEIDEEILDSAYVLDEIVVIHSAEELEALLYNEPKGHRDDEEDDNESEDDELEELKEELEDIDDYKELKKFIKANDLDIKIKMSLWNKSEDKAKAKVEKALEDYHDNLKKGEDEDEEEDIPEEVENEYDADEINEMSYIKLKKLIKKEDLNIDLDDYDKDSEDDLDDLREEVIEELGLEE